MHTRSDIYVQQDLPEKQVWDYICEYFPNHIYSDRKFFKWQHGLGDHLGCRDSSLLGVTQSGDISGFLSCWVIGYQSEKTKLIEAAQSSNIIVTASDPSIYPSLMNRLHQHSVVLASNMTPRASIAQIRFGYQHTELRRFFFFFRKPQFIKNFPAALVSQPVNREIGEHVIDVQSGVVNKSNYKNIFLTLDNERLGYTLPAFKWRYVDHPYFTYKYVEFSCESRKLIFIYRVQRIGEIELFLRISSISGALELLALAMKRFQDLCYEQKICFADFSTNHSFLQDALSRAGWLPDVLNRAIKIPLKFAPLQSTEFTTYPFAIRTKIGTLGLTDFNLSVADVDCDRPTPFGLKNELYLP